MSDRYFLDTNIIVYSFESGEPRKARLSRELMARAIGDGAGMISTQVIQEFLNLALSRFKVRLTISDCRTYLKSVLLPLCKVFPDPSLYDLALEVREHSGFSFYDCLVVAGARSGGCKVLYTEDLQDGYRFRGTTVVNPFREGAR